MLSFKTQLQVASQFPIAALISSFQLLSFPSQLMLTLEAFRMFAFMNPLPAIFHLDQGSKSACSPLPIV